MVSGFLTSPKDHERIMSGEARAIFDRIKLFGFSLRFQKL
ncbi:hypothetical protein [Klebsiella pneumoniae ISC21]|nr:hypothetical protein [Klebsiella pneumoniae ISC21]